MSKFTVHWSESKYPVYRKSYVCTLQPMINQIWNCIFHLNEPHHNSRYGQTHWAINVDWSRPLLINENTYKYSLEHKCLLELFMGSFEWFMILLHRAYFIRWKVLKITCLMSFEKKYIFVHEICNIAEWYYHTWQTVLIKPMTQNQQNKAKTNAINWK